MALWRLYIAADCVLCAVHAVDSGSFDADFARTRRLPVRFIDYAMTVFVAVAIVLTIRMIGIMLLMSLMSLPQMTAESLTRRYRPMIMVSVAVSMIGCVGGLFISYWLSVPASATIVLLLVGIFGLSRLVRPDSLSRR